MPDEPKGGRSDVESELAIKAWNDDAFRQQLLANPKAMTEYEIGKSLPADLKVVIHEETGETLHFVLAASRRAIN